MSRHRRWTFTLNNYTAEDEQRLQGDDDKIDYIIYGREIAPTTGTPHLQGYIEISPEKGWSLRQIKAHLGFPAIHLEAAVASSKKNIDYCIKADMEPYTRGQPREQGKRTDLTIIREAIENGSSIAALVKEGFCDSLTRIQYAAAVRKYQPVEPIDRKIYWIHGPTGCGKTRLVWDLIAMIGESAWVYPGGRFFEGYDGEEVAVFDDYRYADGISFNKILSILDRYPCRVEVKGSSLHWGAKHIFFTSPYSIDEAFRFAGEDLGQIKRRITNVIGPEAIELWMQKN